MNHNWNEQQIEAIKDSIEHWHENLMMLQLNKLSRSCLVQDILIYANDCALCYLYLVNEGSCIDCPLSKIGQRCDRGDDVWSKAKLAILHLNFEKKFEATANMINVLESLLD